MKKIKIKIHLNSDRGLKSLNTHLVVQAPGLGHGGQRHPLPTDVAEDLKNHEAEEEEVETGTDPCHDDEGHLMHRSGKLNY